MSDWLHNLPVVWMALVVFGFTYLVAAAIHAVVTVLAVGERARSFKAVSPGMLPPLGIIFGLFVAFTVAQVWNDNDGANAGERRLLLWRDRATSAGARHEVNDPFCNPTSRVKGYFWSISAIRMSGQGAVLRACRRPGCATPDGQFGQGVHAVSFPQSHATKL